MRLLERLVVLRRGELDDDRAPEVRQDGQRRLHNLVLPRQVALGLAVVERQLLALEERRPLRLDELPAPVALLVAAPDDRPLLPLQSVDAQVVRLCVERTELLRDRIEPRDGALEPREVVPEVVLRDVAVPVPEVSAPRAAREERREERVVEKRTVPV